jgi:hypothetical protein
MPFSDEITVEHIDPRTHHLVCGLKNELNEVMADMSYNGRKTNRFVPYRTCEHNAPVTFGDYAEFLIEGEWVVCEFGGDVWWTESNRVGNSCTAGGKISRDLGLGALTPENSRKGGQITGKLTSMNKTGLHNPEKRSEWASMAGKAAAKSRFRCLVTGYESTSGPLSCYQKARGIDTALRERVK